MVQPKKKKKRREGQKSEDWEVDPGSDFPVHEKYTEMEPVKR